MRSVTFEMPLPPIGCKPGSRGHWAARARAVREYRDAAKIACLAGMGASRPQFDKAEIEYEFFLCRKAGSKCYHPRDADNAYAAMKAAQDGFADARIFAVDDANLVRLGGGVRLYQTAKFHLGKSCVRVTIKEIGAEAVAS